LQRFARMLLEDRELALLMGRQARKTVADRFSPERFKHSFLRSIEIARRKRQTRKIDPVSLRAGLPSTSTVPKEAVSSFTEAYRSGLAAH